MTRLFAGALVATIALMATLGPGAGTANAQSAVRSDRLRGLAPAPQVSEPAEPQDRPVGCLIEPLSVADIAASAGGVLAEVRVDRGDIVKSGDVLAVLDRDVEQAMVAAARARASAKAEIAAAEATRKMAQQKVHRLTQLNKLSHGSQLELELARGELEVAGHRLDQARENHKIARSEQSVAMQQLAQRLVRSPIDGVVAERLLDPGERADGQAIVRVMQVDQLRIELVVPAERFGAVRTGMVLDIQPALKDIGPVPAKVVQVDAFVDAASGTFRARLEMPNHTRAVPAGVRCHVELAPSTTTPRTRG